jgi:hypothetical protein
MHVNFKPHHHEEPAVNGPDACNFSPTDNPRIPNSTEAEPKTEREGIAACVQLNQWTADDQYRRKLQSAEQTR